MIYYKHNIFFIIYKHNIYLLHHFGKKYKSELMIEASKESSADFISTCVVLAILILSLFEKYIPDFINIDKIAHGNIYNLFINIFIIRFYHWN